ncbi:MAG: translesion error-prone DNA polymerase V autoproteolytic subunit [Desulfobulbaceae bacterium]|uniref:Translesion error-prone DNA polymerase V autoproteolytic subunit n=1 Tax=Candidatus Desulfatifera sulfidica TaxID=2841691 RepID=A0A8J6T962_9BACT|nr:translesion error-prone DNA polymerase V autoproteolytic subunit [Candidatus Desulfatifera sulfidica]
MLDMVQAWKSDGSIEGVYCFNPGEKVLRPLFACGVSAGFPSPADDYIERQLDLNELLIRNPPATFFVRVTGDSMTGAGINHDDLLVVDRSLEPASGRIIIAVLNGELTVKRFVLGDGICRLLAENPDYPPQEITADTTFEVWGVVTSVIHSL